MKLKTRVVDGEAFVSAEDFKNLLTSADARLGTAGIPPKAAGIAKECGLKDEELAKMDSFVKTAIISVSALISDVLGQVIADTLCGATEVEVGA